VVTVRPSAFGSLLKRYRTAAGLTQEELAERARLSTRAVSDLERGVRRSPYRDTVQQLADALGLDAPERSGLERAARGVSPVTDMPDDGHGRSGREKAAIRTFLIADVRGYTRFTVDQGDEAAAQLAVAFAAIAREVAAQHEGEVVELRGDEALLVFDSARHALRAAVALQERCAEQSAVDPSLPLHVGVGLDAGEAIPVEGGFRGGALNLAARLCSLAGGGEILCSETVLGIARKTDGIALADRGDVTLKGLAAPVRVMQVAPEGELPAELPPLQPILDAHPTNLPDEPTPFIGRETEIAQVTGLLRNPHVRMVTLTGPGGTGKTRLALQVGRSHLQDFRDGVFFVDLAPLADPDLVPSAIAEALSVEIRAGVSAVSGLTDVLERKHLLLVLDNFEHLLAAAPVVADLLERCRELHVLVTSRTPLHLSWEHEHVVPPLLLPDPNDIADPDRLAHIEAVALFCERARAARSSFAVTSENASALAEICHRLDGLPLALELAAARTRLFSPQALLERLDKRLQLLTGGARDRPTRQQTLRGAVDWSYSLLEEEEKGLFARLSVFWGGCTLAAAGAVAGDQGDDVLDGVASLVEQSLLRQSGEQEPRFVMLETIREYAAERLEDLGDAEQLREEHAGYYLVLAEEGAVALQKPEPGPWLERLEDERDNLRTVLKRFQERGDVDRGLRLALALQRFWMVRGPLSEGRRWLESFGALGGAASLRAAALSAAGRIAAAEGRLRDSADLVERSLRLYEQLGDQRGRAEGLGGLAHAWYHSGEVERADELLRRTEMEARESGDERLLAASLRFQASFAEERRDAERSRLFGEESLALYRTQEDDEGVADVLRILAGAAYGAGDRQKARRLIDELLILLRRAPLGSQEEEWLEPLAYRARMLGDYDYAARILTALAGRSEAAGDRRVAAYARTGLGLLARERGDYARAAALYGVSLTELQEVGDLLGGCRALIGLSDVFRDQGDADRVIELCEEGLAMLREAGDAYLGGFALHNLGMAAWFQGDLDRAEHLFDEALSIFRRQKTVVDATEVLAGTGLLALDRGRYDRAAAILAECLVTTTAIGSRWMMGTLLEGMAGVAAGTGRAERAARLFGAAETAREDLGTPRWPALQGLYVRHVATIMEVLGPERYRQIVEQGRAMTLDEAVSFALQERSDP